MIGIIGTWKMAFSGVTAAQEMLAGGANAGDALVRSITDVENDPQYTSVGFGGLPDLDGHVMTDAAFMDGQSLQFGACMSVENVANPILLARYLCGRETDCLLAGHGAELAAIRAGLQMKDMRTEASMAKWREEIVARSGTHDAYRGHDTVCVIALDEAGNMYAGTSTSGLFLKQPGRVGDSPVIGSGFYCDGQIGAAAATGLGEDIMRGCLSYEIVSLMEDGASPTEACQVALRKLSDRKVRQGEGPGSISVIALAKDGTFGAATTLPVFPFVAGNDKVSLYVTDNTAHPVLRTATVQELENEP